MPTDEQIEAVQQLIQRWKDGYAFNDDCDEDAALEELASAAIAALSAAEAQEVKPRVKPLEWTKHGEAIGCSVKYNVYEAGDGWNCVAYPMEESHYRIAEAVSETKAYLAAQNHHEARILGALE